MRAHHRDQREDQKQDDVHFSENQATRKPVTSRFSTATGNRNFQVKRHQLVVAEARQRAAHPDEGEQDEAGLGRRTRTAAAASSAPTGSRNTRRDDQENDAERRAA